MAAIDVKDIFGAGGISDLLKSAVDRIWPDKTKALEIKAEIDKANAAGNLQALENDHTERMAQIALDQAEVVAGSHWRERLGNLCVLAYGYEFIGYPFLKWASDNFGIIAPPTIAIEPLAALTLGMLGLTGAHMYQAIKQQ